MNYEFLCEDGAFKLDYKDYVKAPELIAKIQDRRRFLLNLGLVILSFDRDWLNGHRAEREMVEFWQREYDACPIRFFLPNCANSDSMDSEAHRFINDASHVVTGMLAGKRFGKSSSMWAKFLLTYAIIPTDRRWECFTKHGITYRPHTGPKEIMLNTYNWLHHRETLWPKMVRAWTPRNELGSLMSWEMPKITSGEMVKLACETKIHFKALSQPAATRTSAAFDHAGWDEQPNEEPFDESNARLRTRRAYAMGDDGFEYLTSGAHVLSCTPHRIDGRPDTGAGTFIHRMALGQVTKGMSVRFYHGNLHEDVPDWIFSEREKQSQREAIAEAIATGSRRNIRKLRSEIDGEFEEGGGLVIEEWEPAIHVIPDMKIPWNWCAVRMGDHGRVRPSAFLWVAITPQNDWVVFRDFEEAGLISEVVAKVVAMSGNILLDDTPLRNGDVTLATHREKLDKERYMTDVIDGRSFKNPDPNTKFTIGQLYQKAGMTNLRPAVIHPVKQPLINVLRQRFTIDPKRKHIVTGQMGAPAIYFFQSCRKSIACIGAYRNRAEKRDGLPPSEKPQEGNDHLPDALLHGTSLNLRWSPGVTIRNEELRTGEVITLGYSVKEDKRAKLSRAGGRRVDQRSGY